MRLSGSLTSAPLAHYYSNLGVEKLQNREYLQAFLHLRKGLQLDPQYSVLWTNLGALYSRIGEPEYVETSYLIAVRQSDSMVAISNLARLYERMGNAERAGIYTARVARFRARNPYYRYYLAQKSFRDEEFKTALDHLRQAIRIKPEEDAFYFLMGVVYLQSGDPSKARNYFEEARQVAADDRIKRRYSDKMRRLLKDQEGENADA